MNNDYILINKKALPEHFQLVLKIKELVNAGKKISVACKEVGLSRSTYYKYKDYVFLPPINSGKKLAVSFKLNKNKSLVNILNQLADESCNIISINETIPINNVSLITLIMSVENSVVPQEFVKYLKQKLSISDIKLMSAE